MSSKNTDLDALRTKLYLDFLRSIALEDHSLQDILVDITLGTLIYQLNQDNLTSTLNNDRAQRNPEIVSQEIFQCNDLYAYGTPSRSHLSHLTRKRLLSEAQKTLQSITEFFRAGTGLITMDASTTSLPETIQLCRTDTMSMKEAILITSSRLTELVVEIETNREQLDREMIHAKSTVFPLYDAARMASIDLLAATIEASLVNLSLIKARTERALYNHRPKDNYEHTVAQAIRTVHATLKYQEREMKLENQKLDRQLQEYENLLMIVDGAHGNYQQIINDWAKVKQETDECMRDLKRLGWTGD